MREVASRLKRRFARLSQFGLPVFDEVKTKRDSIIGDVMKIALLAVTILLFCSALPAQQPTAAPSWDTWNYLIGKWVGEGTSDVGHGAGYFTFEQSLNGRVLVRRNRADYPATQNRAAVSHEDLMIVFVDPATKQTRAFYTDTEGHVIQYTASLSNNGNTLTFLSDILPAAPRFRLTYIRTKPDEMALTFEIAPPGKPDEFRKVIDATVRKSREGK